MRALIYISLGFIWKLEALTATSAKCTKEKENIMYYIYKYYGQFPIQFVISGNRDCTEFGLSMVEFGRGNSQELLLIFEGKVDIWTAGEDNKTKYLSSMLNDSGGVVAVELVKNFNVCAVNIWKTNIKGILASSEYIFDTTYNIHQIFQYHKEFEMVHTTIKSYCGAHEQTGNQNVENSTWYYIYTFWAPVSTYHCFYNISASCEALGLNSFVVSENITEHCIQKRYNSNIPSQSNGYYNIATHGLIKLTVCVHEVVANLLTNEIHFSYFLKDANYSAGYLYDSKTFPNHYTYWLPHPPCNNFKQIYEGNIYAWSANQSMFIDDSNCSSSMNLMKRGNLCDVNVWYTDRNGTVVSQQKINSSTNQMPELKYKNSKCGARKKAHKVNNTTLCSAQELVVKKNATLEYINACLQTIDCKRYFLRKIILCSMVYIGITLILDTYLNFLTLRTAGQKRENKNKLYLLNCVSQSLTNRYLILNNTSDKKLDKLANSSEVATTSNTQELYEYIDF